MTAHEATHDGAAAGSEDRRHEIFVVVFGIWLAGFWCCPNGWIHRFALVFVVLPALWRIRDEWKAVVREERWFHLAAVLLGWQWLSRFWSAGSGSWTAGWLDVPLVVVELGAILVLGRDVEATRRVIRWMVLVAAVTAFLSLLIFYALPEHSLTNDRLRNLFIYFGQGLHPILTGWLCGFGALGAAWACGRAESVRWAWIWRVSLAVLVFGMLASQSRGAYLLFATGFGVFLLLEWHRALAPIVTVAVATVLYCVPFLWAVDSIRHMVQRGSTGRFHFYEWFLGQMHGADFIIGRGMATPPVIPEEVFGWFAHHPHSAYLTQFYLTGLVGTTMLLLLLAWGAWEALRLALKGETLLLVLLAGGVAALIFDGGHVLSTFSPGRMEMLVVVVPAGLAVARSGVMRGEQSRTLRRPLA